MASYVSHTAAVLLILALSVSRQVFTEVIEADCVIEAGSGTGQVAGMVSFRQEDDEDVDIVIALTSVGTSGSKHGFHIHEEGDLGDQCKDAASHYNPSDMDHGAPGDNERHVGDLGNIEVNADGAVYTSMTDRLVKLSGDYSVIGRAVVVHAGEDDLGKGGDEESLKTGNAGAREGCCVIKKRDPPAELDDDIVAKCEIKADSGTSDNNVTGTVIFTHPKDNSETKIEIELSGLDANAKHGFHIHEEGDLGDECKNAKSHYNPAALIHGAPTDKIRHVGDLGNVQANANGEVTTTINDRLVRLTGDISVIRRAVVVHKGEDDLGKGGTAESLSTGNAGVRIGCCVIKEDKSGTGSGASTIMATGALWLIVLLSLLK